MRLPPQYVIVPVGLAYSDLPASIERTAIRIFGLAWEEHRRRQPELPLAVTIRLEELCHICDLSRRQLFSHLRHLVNRGVLRYAYSRSAGIYVINLPPRSQWARVLNAQSAENRTVPVIGVVGGTESMDSVDQSMDSDQQHQSSCLGGECEGGGAECGKPHGADHRNGLMDRLGIYEPVRGEILALAHADQTYLARWAVWFEDQDELGTGWVVLQLRAGADPPRAPAPAEPDWKWYIENSPYAEYFQH